MNSSVTKCPKCSGTEIWKGKHLEYAVMVPTKNKLSFGSEVM
ncbi:hypothetical protein [Halobacillus ihumii]|nr:hypothetical protein [Halobacillus ihumii]